jgi:hypothetical protein
MASECTMTPIHRSAGGADNQRMVQVPTRWHPVAPDEFEHWLDRQVEELRRQVGQGTVRLSRLGQDLRTAALAVGWLLERSRGDEVVDVTKSAEDASKSES